MTKDLHKIWKSSHPLEQALSGGCQELGNHDRQVNSALGLPDGVIHQVHYLLDPATASLIVSAPACPNQLTQAHTQLHT